MSDINTALHSRALLWNELLPHISVISELSPCAPARGRAQSPTNPNPTRGERALPVPAQPLCSLGALLLCYASPAIPPHPAQVSWIRKTFPRALFKGSFPPPFKSPTFYDTDISQLLAGQRGGETEERSYAAASARSARGFRCHRRRFIRRPLYSRR